MPSSLPGGGGEGDQAPSSTGGLSVERAASPFAGGAAADASGREGCDGAGPGGGAASEATSGFDSEAFVSGFDDPSGRREEDSRGGTTTRPTFATIASSTETSTSFEVFATILSQPREATTPFGVPSPVSWMRWIHCVSSSLLRPSARTSVPLMVPPFAEMVSRNHRASKR